MTVTCTWQPMSRFLSYLYSALYALSIVQWFFDTIYYRQQWECLTYRADYPPSVKQQFLYFSMWSLWFSVAIFIGWIRKSSEKKFSRAYSAICWVGLPHVIAVFVSYIYYDVTNPPDEFLDKEACYTLYKSIFSKEITTNETIINMMLVIGLISNFTIHYFSAPLMFILLWRREISYGVGQIWKAYSTVFIIVLGLAVGLSQQFGSPIYNGGIWFNVGLMILANVVIHCILFGINHHWNKQASTMEAHAIEKVGANEIIAEKT